MRFRALHILALLLAQAAWGDDPIDGALSVGEPPTESASILDPSWFSPASAWSVTKDSDPAELSSSIAASHHWQSAGPARLSVDSAMHYARENTPIERRVRLEQLNANVAASLSWGTRTGEHSRVGLESTGLFSAGTDRNGWVETGLAARFEHASKDSGTQLRAKVGSSASMNPFLGRVSGRHSGDVHLSRKLGDHWSATAQSGVEATATGLRSTRTAGLTHSKEKLRASIQVGNALLAQVSTQLSGWNLNTSFERMLGYQGQSLRLTADKSFGGK